MSNPPAAPAIPPPAESWLMEPKPADERWTNRKFIFVVVLVLGFHLALIFLFGTKKQIVPVLVGPMPHLQLADGVSELIALSNPTLFARPNAHDLVSSFWRQPPAAPQTSFDWPKLSHYLAPDPTGFGSVFHEFVQNSRPAEAPVDFKPQPAVILPEMDLVNPVPQNTTLRFSDELVRRPLLETISPPVWPRNDVIEPSTVQVLVDSDGMVDSSVVLKSSRDNGADQLALQLVRRLRFAPARQLMFGEITFFWCTVPTNAPPAQVP